MKKDTAKRGPGRPRVVDEDAQMVTVPLPRELVADLDAWAEVETSKSRNALIRRELEAAAKRWKRRQKK